MNKTNIKHGYSLMVCEARGAILNPGAQISKAGAEFMPPGAQYWSQPGQIVWPLSPASWWLWAWLNSLSDSGMATGMNKSM